MPNINPGEPCFRVLRYTLQITDAVQSVGAPASAETLSVAVRRTHEIDVWIKVAVVAGEPIHRFDGRTKQFRVFGTGHEIPVGTRLRFVGTVLDAGGLLVWHVFEEMP
jgi:hypothetical protein